MASERKDCGKEVIITDHQIKNFKYQSVKLR